MGSAEIVSPVWGLEQPLLWWTVEGLVGGPFNQPSFGRRSIGLESDGPGFESPLCLPAQTGFAHQPLWDSSM